MGLVWNSLALTGLFALLFSWTIAGFVYFTSSNNLLNRRLGLLLFVEGTAFGSATGLQFLMGEAADARAWRAVSIVASLAMPFLYLRFLALLDTPLSLPLKTRTGQALLALAALAAPALWFTHPEKFIDGMISRPSGWFPQPGPWFRPLLDALLLTYIYGFAVALTAFLGAKRGTIARRRARGVTIAFGTRDAMFILQLASYPLWQATPALRDVFLVYSGLIPILFVALFSYAILKTQVFDLDLRLKGGFRRGVIVGVFVLVFFLASEGTERLVAARAGPVGGFLVAGLLAFAIRPIEAAASRIASATFPGVSTEEDYLRLRKQDVYRAAVESALEEGGIDIEEHGILRRLREKLGLDRELAETIERDARSKHLSAPSPDAA